MTNLDIQQFAMRDLVEVTGLSERRIQNWLLPKRGLVQISGDQSPGSGRPRLFSAAEICEFALLKALTDARLPIAAAVDVTRHLIVILEASIKFRLPLYGHAYLNAAGEWLVSSGDDLRALHEEAARDQAKIEISVDGELILRPVIIHLQKILESRPCNSPETA